MENAVARKNKILLVTVVVLGIAVWLAVSSGRDTTKLRGPVETPRGSQATDPLKGDPKGQDPHAPLLPTNAPTNVFIGHDAPSSPRKVQAIFTTHKKNVLYQALVRYEPVDVPSDDVPGIKDILHIYGRQGRELPRTIKRIDQETEMTTNNLGEPMRFVSSLKLYLSPDGGRVIAYDMAQTTGGQPQRMIGHISRNGMAIDVYRGGQLADKQEVTFDSHTWVPVEYTIIHQWFESREHAEAKAKREQVKFSIFVPEAMAQVILLARPMDDQVIPVGDANYVCAHYEVVTASTQSAEGIYARQEMWFNKESGIMMRRQDFDISMAESDAPVTDLETYSRIDQLGRLSDLPIAPPAVPYKSADPMLNEEFRYKVSARDQDIGKVEIHFFKYEEGKSEPPFMPENVTAKPAYFSTARVRVDTGESLRNEVAVTLYDAQWKPIHYETHGEEFTGVKLDYHVAARIADGKIQVATHRDALPELKTSAAYQSAMAGVEAGIQFLTDGGDDAVWHDPLKRVPVSEDEAKAQEDTATPRLMDQSWSRAFPDGIFISDFNRVEHLALIASRLPIPPLPKTENDPATGVFQKVAMYLVRQNRCGSLLFEVRPESKPKLTLRQRQRLTDDELNEPQLYVATVTAAMMPCRILMTKDGRILELTMKYGSGEVTYTLDDPIMRRREEAAKKKKLQEGPRLVRPPWW